MFETIPRACSCQASLPFAASSASELATPPALWQLLRKSGEFFSSDRRLQVCQNGGVP